jgi:sulfoacetaldehyde dehydrogenase
MHDELRKVGAPLDLVQAVPPPVSKGVTHELMRQADFVVVTGSQANVRAAYRSGTPAIGVGLGNAPVIVDATADLEAAASKIRDSKVFDFATSCSSENALLIHQAVYDDMLDALRRRGGVLLSAVQKSRLQRAMWVDGRLSERIIAKPPGVIADAAGLLDEETRHADFFMVEESGVGPAYPFSGEKLSVVLAIYVWRDFEEALDLVQRILDYQGAGHSCGIHTRNDEQMRRLAERIKVARVLVNQAHSVGNGGSFDNGLNFTLTMGAGTWAKNSISENLSYRHFLNVTRLVRIIPPDIPTHEQLWGAYLRKHGTSGVQD